MYPTVYHMFQDWFGIEGGAWEFLKMFNSFGLFVAFAFIAAHFFAKKELLRKQEIGQLHGQQVKEIIGLPAKTTDYITTGIVGLILGYKVLGIILDRAEVFENPPQYLLSTKGNIFGGIILAVVMVYLRYRNARKNTLPEPKEVIRIKQPVEHLGSITVLAAVFGILGAKLFCLLEDPIEFVEFFTSPTVEGFMGGLTIYGGLIAAILAIAIYMRKHKLSLLHMYDAGAPALIFAYAIGRMGCQISGDGDWGIENPDPIPSSLSFLPSWMWAYDYPNNVNKVGFLITEGQIFEGYGTHLRPKVFPAPVYEIIMSFIIFGVLWFLRKRMQVAGTLFALYLILNGIERFLIEFIRVNKKYEFFGMKVSQAQIIAIILILMGLVGYAYLKKRQAHETD